jgi:hypothetical protein
MWVGWLRPSPTAPWQRVCQAPDLDACARLLGAEADRRGGIPCRLQVMTGGAVPDLDHPCPTPAVIPVNDDSYTIGGFDVCICYDPPAA